jgi:hypothetical protein
VFAQHRPDREPRRTGTEDDDVLAHACSPRLECWVDPTAGMKLAGPTRIRRG